MILEKGKKDDDDGIAISHSIVQWLVRCAADRMVDVPCRSWWDVLRARGKRMELTLELCASATDAKTDSNVVYYLCWTMCQADDKDCVSLRVLDSRTGYSLRCSSTCLTNP